MPPRPWRRSSAGSRRPRRGPSATSLSRTPGRARSLRSRQREQRRLQRAAGELLDAEMRRLQAESDAQIEEALSQVESNTRVRMQREADRRLAEREEELRAAAETRVRAAGETARKQAEAQFQEEIETARLEAEAEARTAAAEWIRSQTRALQREAERSFAERERPSPSRTRQNKTPRGRGPTAGAQAGIPAATRRGPPCEAGREDRRDQEGESVQWDGQGLDREELLGVQGHRAPRRSAGRQQGDRRGVPRARHVDHPGHPGDRISRAP